MKPAIKNILKEKARATACGPEKESRAFFLAIEQLAVLRKFQNDLYRLTGLPFDFLDLRLRHSSRLHAQRYFTPFCRMVNKTSAGCRACERDEEEAVAECIAGRRTVVRRCHLGLIDLYVPIVMGDRIEGLFCAGQFFACRPSEETFRKVAGKLKSFGIKLPEARRAYFTAPVIEKKRVAAVIDLLEMVVGLVDARRLQTLQSAVAHDPLRRALDYIEAHYAEPLRITLAASEAGLSASRLAHVFKSQMGMSFTAYMNLVRVSWAKCFLANSSQRVSETAFRVGFGNLSHFNHVFRRLTGLAPRQFQQQSGTRK